ncbi:probable ATP-dependent RNA helicase DDX43 [Microplitis demolitor]|uniref:probable ATP-dependent RNA helicase DDX43 n=1 Tax=Microplitis demolitor TaxID=69319 RepID=UPI0006D5087A|nr:probable ATP-dependent RNA helicase DDX43 [Microplitis demolitor]
MGDYGGNRPRGGGRGGNRRNNDGYQRREWTNSNRDRDNNQGRESRNSNSSYGGQGSQESVTIQIQQRHVGKIIGRGGSTIKDLQAQSGAHVNIDKAQDGENTSVKITGSDESREKAQQMINDLINESSSYGSGQSDRQSYGSRQNDGQSYGSRQNDGQSYGSRQNDGQSYGSRYNNGQSYESSYNNQQNQNYSRQDSSSAQYDNWQQPAPAQQHSNLSSQPQKQERDVLDFGDFDWTSVNEEQKEFERKRWKDLKPLKKNFYNEDPEVANMSPEEVAQIRLSKNNIDCRRMLEDEADPSNNKVPNPVTKFEHAFHDYPEILEEIRKQGFKEPSPIQCQAWPVLLSGRDLIGIAQTGTGKTLAFLLPALIHIDGQETPREKRVGPNVMIMAPTRELALQIFSEVKKYSYRGIKATCLYGGGSRKEQVSSIEKGVNIVIATPGRLNDLVMAGTLNVSEISYIVLDEADRMLDMGFEPQIRKALIDVRPDRQTVMTSATWPDGVRRLVNSYMNDPVQVYVGSLDLAATHSVRQTILIVDESEKTQHLHEFFQSMGEKDKAMVFFGKKARVDDLASELALAGVTAQSIHGGRDQLDREQALADLKSGEVKILLATDVASRGIDIEDITYVFNYDFPRDIEEYVHRVGRTGRAGRSGESISLVTRGDWAVAKNLISILEEASQEVPEELYKMTERYDAWKDRKAQEKDNARIDAHGGGGRFGGGGGRGGGGGGWGGGGGGGRRGGGRGRNDYSSSFY